MESRKIVVALGGNALGNTPEEQKRLVKSTVKPIVDLIQRGDKVIIAHGNGPQVGMINLALETASKTGAKTPKMPFPECGAMSQGYIGFHLQNALREELLSRRMNIPVATVITQVIVNKQDPAFDKPSKPIGAFYSREEALAISKEKGYIMKEDAGRGWRRVVPSPIPIDVAEKKTIKTLVDNGEVVITVGGGGIPVIAKGNSLIGVSAVIDKDFASEKIAEILDANLLIILTSVDKTAINYGKPNQANLDMLTIKDAEKYIEQGQFAPGSMLPKVQAAIKFVKSSSKRKAIITSLERAADAIEGKTGTVIVA
ncbi:carbamate kinase [Clostridium autoethanogenum]|uniref:Carbamate kinase n=1 Tax=Clostridium autoethanogenum DSM 10061 TaxID=1341692 RepID=A0ABM5NZ86_9CLOT|nr:carbamate kinase [Clostridium autoethanogenum]AGY77835.1 carbamate kinase [Clostridium autoethanogenum DSM 10061]ALU37969.1 Carbamate kinase [Clostridium autoethanogenum DSM 10061]OVY50733.1 Carbamate kinase 1 [Clostridium autoethanogenum]